MKKVIFILTLVWSFSVSAASEGWKNCDDEGTANCEYQIKDGVLTIRPQDDSQPANIPDFERDCSGTRYPECTTSAPWRWEENTGTITTLNVEAGISSVGYDAFEDMPFQKVVLPEGLTSIGGFAFTETPQLTEINLPSSLETLGNFSLAATSLTNLELPASLTTIGFASLGYLPNVEGEGIMIPENVTDLSTAFTGYGGFKAPWNFVYCKADLMEQCAAVAEEIGGQAIEYIKNEDGSFSADGQTYLNVSDMQKGYACGDENTCAAIKTAYQTGENIKIDGKEYRSIEDFINGNEIVQEPVSSAIELTGDNSGNNNDVSAVTESIFNRAERGKRIYTIKEAKDAAGKKNKVMIRYK